MLYRDYCIHRGVRGHDATWVAPFGYPGIIACWQLPQAFRSLLRPSSPVVPRYPPVCSYVLTKTRSIRNTIFEIAVHACAWTRSHVWHMKVLLYAVFKERGLANRTRRSSVPSKLNSAVPTKLATCASIVLQETLEVRAAQPMLKNIGPFLLIHALALKSRVNPESAASSVVDKECIRRCDHTRRDPTTCTP
jgi:hypothetical protein